MVGVTERISLGRGLKIELAYRGWPLTDFTLELFRQDGDPHGYGDFLVDGSDHATESGATRGEIRFKLSPSANLRIFRTEFLNDVVEPDFGVGTPKWSHTISRWSYTISKGSWIEWPE